MAGTRNPQEALFQQILAELKEMNAEIAGLRVEMENFKQTLEPITRIIRGDGVVQSIGTQIEVMRNELTHIKAAADKVEKKNKELEDRADKTDQEDKKGKWMVLAALITGGFGLIGAVAAIIAALVKH